MKFKICSFILLVSLASAISVSAQTTTIDFNNEKVGEAPSGFSTALTGKGKPGKWAVTKDDREGRRRQRKIQAGLRQG